LGDYDAGVEDEFAFAVFACVLVAALDKAHVERHGDGCMGCDAPPVKHPFEWDFEMADGGVAVDEDDKSV
jgi:hypothetical protein